MKNYILVLVLVIATNIGLKAQGNYTPPNNNGSCPSGCRQITWVTGSDIWNSGVLPTYTNVTCTGLAGNGTTDDGPAIQACINALSSGQAAFIPAGHYLINSTVRLKSNTVLRGAKPEGGPPFLPTADAAATTFLTGTNWFLTTPNFSFTSGGLFPATAFQTMPSTCAISGTPQKGDTTLTLGTIAAGCNVSVGTYIKIFGNDNPSLISLVGDDGWCNFCSDADGFFAMQQIVQVTAINSGTGGSGSNITISKALYYPPDTTSRVVTGTGGSGTVTEPAGAKYNIINFGASKAGFENFRVDGSNADVGSTPLILFQGCTLCWGKAIETYDTGSSSESGHVVMQESYGVEIRDSAMHDQRSGASGAGYGIYSEYINGDLKVENNILFHNRHAFVNQGGTSGSAYLYNFADDGYTDDTTYLASSRFSHGAHPFFNLIEGNIFSHFASDNFFGTSSHDVIFRNWMYGGEPNTVYSGGSSIPGFPPNIGFVAEDVYPGQTYYTFVNNVLGKVNPGTGGVWSPWASATIRTFSQFASSSSPVVYSLGGTLTFNGATVPSSDTTSIQQGNYDYKTNGVAFNDGGTGFTYQPSYYYSSKPSFLGTCTYPGIGSDISGQTNPNAAFQRAAGVSCSAVVNTNSVLSNGMKYSGGTKFN